jgi:hypothetical protein
MAAAPYVNKMLLTHNPRAFSKAAAQSRQETQKKPRTERGFL